MKQAWQSRGISFFVLLLMVSMLLACGDFSTDEARPSPLLIEAASSSIYPDYTIQMTAIAYLDDLGPQDVTLQAKWSSSDTGVATVSSSGLVTGRSMGTAVISAFYEMDRASFTVTVQAGSPLESITVTPSSASIVNGTTQQFTATGTFIDNSTMDISSLVAWGTTNPAVAVVDAAGLATAKGSGTVTISASYQGIGSISSGGNATLTVTPSLVSIDLSPGSVSIANGLTYPFSATANYDNGYTVDVTALADWDSNNTAVATVGLNTGIATAEGEGTALINAAYSGVTSANATLTVDPAALVSIWVTPTSMSIVNGTDQQFTATGTYTDGIPRVITTKADWRSDDTAVATIGLNTGLAASEGLGTALINASYMGVASNYATLNVTTALVSISVSPTPVSIINGQGQQFTATATYDDGSTPDISAIGGISWKSSDTFVASVDPYGYALSKGLGTALINASYMGVQSNNAELAVDTALLSINITPLDPSAANGTTVNFYAEGSYDDGTTPDLTGDVTWISGDTSVADIDTAGLATTKKEGSTVISATYGGVDSNDSTLTVGPAALVSILVSPPSPSIANSTFQQFSAEGTYTDGSKKDITSAVTWSSDDTFVVSIDTSGFAFANGIGTAIINAVDPVSAIAATDSTGEAAIDVYGTWKLVREEYDIGNTGSPNRVVYYDYSADPAGSTIVETYDDDNDTYADTIYTKIYNTSGRITVWDIDSDGDLFSDGGYLYFYNSTGKQNFVQSYDALQEVISEYTYFYNAAGYLAQHDTDNKPFGSVDSATYYYHDNATGYRMKMVSGVFGYTYFYEYDIKGNKTYVGVDTTGDGVADSSDLYLYDLVTNEKIWHGEDWDGENDGDRVSDSEEAYSYIYDINLNLSEMHTDIGNNTTVDDVTTYYWQKI